MLALLAAAETDTDTGYTHCMCVCALAGEGCEWETIPAQVFAPMQQQQLSVGQLQIELHLWGPAIRIFAAIKHFFVAPVSMLKIKEFFSAADSAGMRSFHKERNPWCNGFKVLCYCSCSFVLKLADDDAAAMLIYQRMTLRTVQYTKVSCILLEMYFSGQCSGQTLVQLQ